MLAGLVGGIAIQRLLESWQLMREPAPRPAQETSPESDVISLPGLLHVLTRQPLLWERLLPNCHLSPGHPARRGAGQRTAGHPADLPGVDAPLAAGLAARRGGGGSAGVVPDRWIWWSA